MRAAYVMHQDAGDPLGGLGLGELDAPAPPAGWVRVHVQAASLNHHDLWSLRGVGLPAERLPMVLGTDAAGRTDDGRDVVVHAVVATAGWEGDETLDPRRTLLSELHPGTLADEVWVPERNVVPRDPALDVVDAACLPTAYLTAYRLLFDAAGLRPGQTVLVQGAGGGVATAAILLGRGGGLRVWVTSRDPGRAARAVELGAHEAFEAGARLPHQVDAVVETVGEATWSHSLKALRPGGVIAVAGATSGAMPPADLNRVFFRSLRVVGSTMGTRAQLVALQDLLVATGVRPVLDGVRPFDETRAAFERLASGEAFGKIVLTLT
ncbi:Alcohol dehydrogenase zinc-binding domain protein [Beutenbergia cavernae DSM 12333]|uniref:Alcohol dehydrogenase zinc-binding domain protein n=1 Tax=Beutenbergia cavernae (strain ATCC BAA-8 / DSM 12333 / CCUG 43141 / JCM 11478 / NBRC 16432 / NCIMB 13614 / HKI 0122) TaxID=471853 RepID=C5C1Q9_BEUC1|nr:Zn-dependent alcohol dehydrogenase [Beutenbergia cavernae]ACQ79527.1 Alcohol dehydrogenase zinc-binding domain protein [Beutenbergia cavernae DSM 12333]